MSFNSHTAKLGGQKSKRPKDSTHLRKTILELMNKQGGNIETALTELSKSNPYHYLTIVEKMLSHALPKLGEVQELRSQATWPSSFTFNVIKEAETEEQTPGADTKEQTPGAK